MHNEEFLEMLDEPSKQLFEIWKFKFEGNNYPWNEGEMKANLNRIADEPDLTARERYVVMSALFFTLYTKYENVES